MSFKLSKNIDFLSYGNIIQIFHFSLADKTVF